MKKALIFVIAAGLAATFYACTRPGDAPPEAPGEEQAATGEASQQEQETAPDPTQPDGALVELLEGAKHWDTAAVEQYLPDGVTVDQYVPAALQDTAAQILGRMEYGVKEVIVEGDRAMVEMEITAVDAQGAVNDAVTAAIGYIAKQQLTGKAVDNYEELAQVIYEAVDVSALSTTTTTATAYMVQDGDGGWRLDQSTEDNLPLLNAISGGSLDIAERLLSLAETYGIPLG